MYNVLIMPGKKCSTATVGSECHGATSSENFTAGVAYFVFLLHSFVLLSMHATGWNENANVFVIAEENCAIIFGWWVFGETALSKGVAREAEREFK